MSRSFTFTIEGDVETQVTVVENIDGTLTFTVEVDESSQQADLRGLFFDVTDESVLENLVVVGADVTNSQFEANKVKDLGNGANMNGEKSKKGSGFDAGVEFGTPGKTKDDIDTTSFILGTNDGTPLTLELLTQMDFGVRLTSVGTEGDRESSLKNVGTAPAVPVANDDADVFVEAGDTVVVDVLANDTDADGTLDAATLAFSGADVGTASNVGGQLSYAANDDSVPNVDESTSDTLTYTVDDDDGITSNTASIVVNVIDPGEESDVDSSTVDSPNDQLLTVAMTTEDRTFNDSSFVNIDIDVGALDQPDINVSFVIDESGSVSAAEFVQEQLAVQNAIDLLRAEFLGSGTDVEIQIVQFASGASSATYDLFDSALDNVTTGTPIASQSGGGTNYEAALNQSVTFFTGQGGDENFLLFVSDGQPTQGGEYLDEVAELDALNVSRTAVGFSGATQGTLDQIDNTGGAQVVANAGLIGDAFAASALFPADVFEFNLLVNGVDQGVGIGDLTSNGGGDFSYDGTLLLLDNSHGATNTVVATVGFDTNGDGAADAFRDVTTEIIGTNGSDVIYDIA